MNQVSQLTELIQNNKLAEFEDILIKLAADKQDIKTINIIFDLLFDISRDEQLSFMIDIYHRVLFEPFNQEKNHTLVYILNSVDFQNKIKEKIIKFLAPEDFLYHISRNDYEEDTLPLLMFYHNVRKIRSSLIRHYLKKSDENKQMTSVEYLGQFLNYVNSDTKKKSEISKPNTVSWEKISKLKQIVEISGIEVEDFLTFKEIRKICYLYTPEMESDIKTLKKIIANIEVDLSRNKAFYLPVDDCQNLDQARLESLSQDEVYYALFGPCHPYQNLGLALLSTTIDQNELTQYIDKNDYNNIWKKIDINKHFGGARMLLDTKYIEDGETDWFIGACQQCHKKIMKRCHAVRQPRPVGGWRGCYCSWYCVRKELNLYGDYSTSMYSLTGTKYLIDYFEDQNRIMKVVEQGS
jgi:hypothetical protein